MERISEASLRDTKQSYCVFGAKGSGFFSNPFSRYPLQSPVVIASYLAMTTRGFPLLSGLFRFCISVATGLNLRTNPFKYCLKNNGLQLNFASQKSPLTLDANFLNFPLPFLSSKTRNSFLF